MSGAVPCRHAVIDLAASPAHSPALCTLSLPAPRSQAQRPASASRAPCGCASVPGAELDLVCRRLNPMPPLHPALLHTVQGRAQGSRAPPQAEQDGKVCRRDGTMLPNSPSLSSSLPTHHHPLQGAGTQPPREEGPWHSQPAPAQGLSSVPPAFSSLVSLPPRPPALDLNAPSLASCLVTPHRSR